MISLGQVIARRLERWLLDRKPYSVALVGIHSGSTSPPLDFLRFKTYEEAEHWILSQELLGTHHTLGMTTEYVVVDLRAPETAL